MEAIVRRPAESAISEGNLVENPLFVLNNKDSKPKDKAAYSKVIPLGTIILDNRAIERSVKLVATPEYGFPTTFAYRVLLAIIEKGYAEGLQSPKVPITRWQIAKALGYRSPSRKDYQAIENACDQMASMYIKFSGTWYDRTTKKRAQDRDAIHLLDKVSFRNERQATLPGLEEEVESGYVVLGDDLFKSLRAGYYNGVDLQYINALNRSSLAQVLYSYLTKKDAGKTAITLGLRELAMRFDIKKRAPSALYAAFEPALDMLTQRIPVGDSGTPRRFLESWSFDKAKCQVTVRFYRPAGEPAQLDAPPDDE